MKFTNFYINKFIFYISISLYFFSFLSAIFPFINEFFVIEYVSANLGFPASFDSAFTVFILSAVVFKRLVSKIENIHFLL